MTIDDKIRDEKLLCDINREATKISALSSGKIDKYEYLSGQEILQFDQSRIIGQAKLKNKQKQLRKKDKKKLKF